MHTALAGMPQFIEICQKEENLRVCSPSATRPITRWIMLRRCWKPSRTSILRMITGYVSTALNSPASVRLRGSLTLRKSASAISRTAGWSRARASNSISFRNHGDFHEDCVNKIMKDLIRLMDPKYIEVTGLFTPRGGISIFPYCNYGRPGTRYEALAEQRFAVHE